MNASLLKSLAIHSPAKLNLFLSVLNRRPDGYHNIVSLFERITLSDVLVLTELPEDKIVIETDSRKIPLDRRNLAYRAADLIKKSLDIKKGIKINIEKNIPVGAGLAGGSSNAASVLLGLNQLFRLKLPKKSLLAYANELGSDVAFFILDEPFALGKGRGTELKAVSLSKQLKLWHLLFVLPLEVMTKDVYGLWDEEKKNLRNFGDHKKSLKLTKKMPDVNILISCLRQDRLSMLNRHIYNRLSETVMKSYGLVSELRSDLLKFGLKDVHMSGSGPALFTVFGSETQARKVFQKMRGRFSDRCRVFLASTLTGRGGQLQEGRRWK